jgi:hypothetical protein
MIEGIPEGWELVRIGSPEDLEWIVSRSGLPLQHLRLTDARLNKNYIIIRKIEKPKEYRPFANAAEAEPFFDRKLRYKGNSSCKLRLTFIGEAGCGIGDNVQLYKEAFERCEFDDGAPFGIEIT